MSQLDAIISRCIVFVDSQRTTYPMTFTTNEAMNNKYYKPAIWFIQNTLIGTILSWLYNSREHVLFPTCQIPYYNINLLKDRSIMKVWSCFHVAYSKVQQSSFIICTYSLVATKTSANPVRGTLRHTNGTFRMFDPTSRPTSRSAAAARSPTEFRPLSRPTPNHRALFTLPTYHLWAD